MNIYCTGGITREPYYLEDAEPFLLHRGVIQGGLLDTAV